MTCGGDATLRPHLESWLESVKRVNSTSGGPLTRHVLVVALDDEAMELCVWLQVT